jgi:glutathione S-transferase
MVNDDDGFFVAESGAVLLYIAEKAGKLIPSDFQGRMRVIQWCFAALTTVERPLMEIQMIDKFGGEGVDIRRAQMVKEAGRWLAGLESRLDGREWVACTEFTAADILLATVLREIRKTELMDSYPRLKAYYARALARPTWQRTLKLYSDLLRVAVEDIS